MIIGRKIIQYQEIDSTNEEARRLIKKGEGEGLVVVAESQKRGKGKPGSSWFSPPGSVYLSAVIKPYKNPKELAPITLLGALAARAMIAKVAKLGAVIKWPNDLRLCGRKVGGVLTERMASGHLIIGIGINVNVGRSAFPEKLKEQSTSLQIETGRAFPLPKCTATLMRELDREYLAYLAKV